MKRNAVIMAAGTSSRFVPLSWELPKGLLEVKGEILIERQIRQLIEAGVTDITVIVGYMAEKFMYLRDKFGVDIVLNEDYEIYNNTSSLIRVVDRLGNTFICSSDNYFLENVFNCESEKSFYSAMYADGETCEYCIKTDCDDNIIEVAVGGKDSWYMIGHVYFKENFSNEFREILKKEYSKEETRKEYWEDLYIKHIKTLPKMRMKKYKPGQIIEFDCLEELREFDETYISDTRSTVIKKIANSLNCQESELCSFKKLNLEEFKFNRGHTTYTYNHISGNIFIQ